MAQDGFVPERLAKIRKVVASQIEAGQIPGAVVLVSRHGRTALLEAQGYRDIEAGAPMRLDTIFRVYSMTKPVTVVAALQLVEDGKIELDDPVGRHVPELANLVVAGTPPREPKRPMTVRDLMRHTSGLVYGFGSTSVDRAYRQDRVLDPSGNLKDMIGKLAKIPLLTSPGTSWEYSVSIDVLGHIVELASGRRLDAYFRERIFEPLGMVDTGFHVPKADLGRLAVNYRFAEGKLAVLDAPASSSFANPPSLLSGGGGLVSTAADYLLFCRMLLEGGALNGKRILRPESVAAMTKNQLPPSVKAIRFGSTEIPGLGFGLGVSVWTRDMGGFGAKGEYSWGGAATTTFWTSPRDALIVLALTQVMPRAGQLDQAIRPLVRAALRFGPL